MIDYATGELALNGKREKIIRSEVWYKTPVGLVANMQDAVQLANELDMNPVLTIIPVPVFIGETFWEVKD